MYRKLIGLVTVLVYVSISSEAQENQPGAGFGIEVNTLAGKVIKHSSKFTLPIPPLSTAQDLNFVWQTYGRKDWQQRRNFPMVGIGFTYTDYGNNLVLGRCVGIYPNIQVPIIRRENMEWTFRFGDGLGYVTKKFQSRGATDTENIAIGSHLNDFAIFMTDMRFHMDDHLDLQFGMNFTHISNGDYHQPNLGVNMAGIHMGIRYFPATSRPRFVRKELKPLSDRVLVQARFSVSYKEARAKDSLIKPAYLGALYVSKRWLNKNKVFFGIDYAYHEDIYAFLKNYGVNYGHEPGHSWDGAFIFGNEFLVGRLGLITQVGLYYKQTFLKYEPIYEKIGGHFYLIQREHGAVKEVFLSGLLLTHWIVAQLAEFGVGVGI